MDHLQTEQILDRDICDVLEDSAIESAQHVSQEVIQLSTCPRAHACVQGVVERRFYPIHITEFYSVINLLLLQLFLLRRELLKAAQSSQTSPRINKPDVNDVEEIEKLQKRLQELRKELKESKRKYNELFRINHQWAEDYAELNKKVSESTQDKSTLLLPCDQCVQYEKEIHEKTGLIKDLNQSYDKVKVFKKDLEETLEEMKKDKQTLEDECKALSLQLEELGGMNAAIRQKEERKDLIQEVMKLREKNLIVERERARLQTQLNRFRHSVRELLFDTNSQTYPSSSSTLYTTSRYPMTTHTHTPSHTNPYYTSSSTFNAHDSYSSRKLGRNTGYRVNPQQFAPRTTGRSQFPTGYHEYNTPPTPPGYLSRGHFPLLDNTFEVEKDHSTIKNTYTSHPYKSQMTEQVTGLTNGRSQSSSTSRFLDLPNTYSSDKLPSPLSVPRPMSAPGSLQEAISPIPIDTQQPMSIMKSQSPVNHTVDSTANELPNQTYKLSSYGGSNPDFYQQPSYVKLSAKRVSSVDTNSSGYYGSSPFANHIPLPYNNGFCDDSNLCCPHCNAMFPRQQDSYDKWFDHVIACSL